MVIKCQTLFFYLSSGETDLGMYNGGLSEKNMNYSHNITLKPNFDDNRCCTIKIAPELAHYII
jgi:hypothetical protein